jgi:hypothetical protein
MSETPTPPALSAEEWAHPPDTRTIRWACEEVFVGDGATLDTVSRHGLAALALHGQPFGFTREDAVSVGAGVLALRESGCDLLAAELQRVADRIVALLPPE